MEDWRGSLKCHNNSSRRKGLICDYSKSGPDTPHILGSWPYTAPAENSRLNSQNVDFPTLTFLEPRILEHGQLDIPRTILTVPPLIGDLVGDISEVRDTAVGFFETIHPWMPFISKKRFYDNHLKHLLHSQADISLLFVCIKLITEIPPSDPRSLLYNAAKHFLLEVESSGICNIQVLQAGILIALYEVGNALYPAAFLSVGACARFAYALGITGTGPVHASRVTTLVELEERRRVWWAIVILDRLEDPFRK